MTTTSDIARRLVKRDEGWRKFPYRCTAGKLTIGWGHNIEDNGIPVSVGEALLDFDLRTALRDARTTIPNFDGIDPVRQAVCIDLAFAMGRPTLRTFKRMIAAARRSDWPVVAAELLDSEWARQVGDRAVRLARMLETGEVEEDLP